MRNFTLHNFDLLKFAKPIRVLILIIGFLGLIAWFYFSFHHGERVWANQGAGWDGANYAKIAMHFEEFLQNAKIDSYRAKHALPSIMIYYTSKLLNINITKTAEVVQFFLVFQYILLLVSVYYAQLISRFLKFTTKTNYIFYSALFLTLPILKKFLYIPIGTDISAFTIGIIMLYYYLKNDSIKLLISSLLGSFIYPSIVYAGFILLLFPSQTTEDHSEKPEPKSRDINFYIRIIAMLIYIGLIAYVRITDFRSSNSSQQLNTSLFWISVVSILVFIYRLMIPFTVNKIFVKRGRIYLLNLTLVIILVLAVHFITEFISGRVGKQMTIELFIKSIVYGSISNPLASLVCHISYFGPFILIIVIFWKKLVPIIINYGWSFTGFIILYLILSLGRESRQFINAWPVFVTIGCIYLNKFEFSWRFIYSFIGLSIVFSKVWFKINSIPLPWDGALIEFPKQRFFMMNGAWMSTDMYYIHLAGSICCLVILILLLRKEPILKQSKRLFPNDNIDKSGFLN